MENIIITVINALGILGEKGVHWFLDKIEAFVILSTTLVDNALFYKVVKYVQSWTPKNPPVE